MINRSNVVYRASCFTASRVFQIPFCTLSNTVLEPRGDCVQNLILDRVRQQAFLL